MQASGNAGTDVRLANQQTEATPASFKTYGNDPRFAWIQGTVEYDDLSNTWIIMYNDNPRTSDPYGGELTLADDPSLARFRTGDVVRIYGALDQSDKDPRGKPMLSHDAGRGTEAGGTLSLRWNWFAGTSATIVLLEGR